MTARATQPVVSTPFAPESGLDSLEFSDQLNDEIFNTTDFSQLASDDSYLTQCSSFDPNGLINYEENGWLSIIDLPVFLSDRTFQDTTPDSIDLLPDICVGESSGSLVDFQVLGEVDLQWIGPLDNPTQLPQSRPVLYSTNFLVVEKLPYAQIVFGLDVQEDINKMAPHGPSGADLFDT
ncbi:hypothetical protein GTA08_BOTSDO03418 [Botryosphaeria dothidea]|uniref:Uncharacterized protein n=1 Tax=Botryosphaeria dothidea TaxID=55169 RepID=A0A8H4IWM0_9PEZI|nr:hypothetical protein GTA08_BOTSDO03418 [Botryosphaeria dothidea]